MEIKTYKKDSFYSYTLGAFPTIELLKKHKEEALKIFIHSSFDNQALISSIYTNKGQAQDCLNDKITNKL